jgi:acyl transferase domain-containing protein/acyl carrier protein
MDDSLNMDDGLEDIAVIGMAGRFPGAENLEQLWDNLKAGRETIDILSDAELDAAGVPTEVYRADGYVRACSRLADVKRFDAELFGYSPREAAMLDPQSRVSLELAWHALEDAGYDPRGIEASVGVFATASLNTYLLQQLAGRLDSQDFILGLGNVPFVLANAPDFIATRLSYKLDLRGPSVAVQTACSSSLTAIHLARQSILNGECDMALAGGVSIYLPQDRGYQYQDGMMLSRNGRCRAFDADADGVVFGRGGGFVVLKPLGRALAAGDRVRAVIRGSAVNNDGAGKVGFTAPSIAGQARVIAEALADANVKADTIGYIEAHGTGTRLGDPIEVAALIEAFRADTSRQGYCALGTVKSNFGHLDVAAGVTGFIKTVLMLEHEQLVPSLNYTRPNPAVDVERSPFRVNTVLRAWETSGSPRRAGVSAFGMGGTNAHVILEQAPRAQATADTPSLGMHILRLSAQSDESLNALAHAYAEALRNLSAADIEQFCFSANCGRAHLAQRLVVRGETATELSSALDNAGAGRREPRVVRAGAVAGEGPIAFLFPGMGTQFAGMGCGLFQSQPVFRQVLQTCDRLLRGELAVPLLDVLFSADGQGALIDDTTYTQPALFAFEVALAKLWESWGIRPAAVIGHSLGEFAAACIAGLLPLEDGLQIVAARGRLMGSLPSGGAMCAVLESEDKVSLALTVEKGAVSIASINGPKNTVISGDAAAIGRVAQRLLDDGAEVHPLNVRQAFHSHRLDPMLDAFEHELSKVRFGRTAIPLISNLSGKLMTDEGTQAGYWRRHAREAVRFADGIRTLHERGILTYLEIGPHTMASGMAAGCLRDTASLCLPTLRRGRDDSDQIFETVSELYVRGARLDWPRIKPGRSRRPMTLPLYPFARTQYWLDAAMATSSSAPSLRGLPFLSRAFRSPLHSATSFELRVDVTSHDFLADHRIGTAQVFPATGYIEAAFEAAAAAGGSVCTVVLDLEILEPLTVRQSSADVQIILFAEDAGWRFELHALSKNAPDWHQYARGRVSRVALDSNVQLNLSELRARCTKELSGDAYYARLAETGYNYGPAFRGIESLRLGQDECLAEIRCPKPLLAKTAGFCCHPALFDACLQTVLSLVPSGRNFLPTHIGEVTQLAPLAPQMLVHSRIRRSLDEAAKLVADVQIMDAIGTPLMHISGILLRERRVDLTLPAAGRTWKDWLYEIAWRPAPGSGSESWLPAPATLRASLFESLARLRREVQMQDYEEIQGQLDADCAGYVRLALRQLGWQPRDGDEVSTAELSTTLGVLPKHRPNLHRLLEMLAEDGLLEQTTGDHWRVMSGTPILTATLPPLDILRARYPRFDAMFEMVERCGRALGPGLTGVSAIVDLLFPGGSLADMERLYHRSPFAKVYNSLAAQFIDTLVEADSSASLRVLEVGAGTGGTSAAVLPRLPGGRTRYVYTDVSPLFLARAEERFAQYPFIEYRVYDVERDPISQGIEAAGYDLIIASNVVHTAIDLKEALQRLRGLLAPGGQLLLVEGIGRQRWVDLLFGLTEGWWRFTDHGLRPDYPLLSLPAWTTLLRDAGFEDSITVPDAPRAADLFHQAIILARRPIIDHESRVRSSRRSLLVTQRNEPFAQLIATQIAEAGGSSTRFDANSSGCEQAIAAGGYSDIVFLATVPEANDPAAHAPDLSSTHALLTLVQSLAIQTTTPAPRLWIITRGARAVLSSDRLPAVNEAALWGLAEVITLEQPQLRCSCIDLDQLDEAAAKLLLQEFERESNETRLALRSGTRHVARLTRGGAEQPAADAQRKNSQRVRSVELGVLDALQFDDVSRHTPGSRQVEIRVHAAGLNFKDLLTALGRFDVPAAGLGHECAGEIVAVGSNVHDFAVGDAVMAFTPGSLADYVLADAAFVAHKPTGVSFDQAAAFPGAFLTAHHALFELAKLRAGESVLIHAASGGVGLAALQLAQRAGAEIYTTAGSDLKRSHLRALGVKHVFDSRTAAFADAIRSATAGRGVDVILNSLTGDALVESRRLLAAGGRFVELGRGHAQIDERETNAGRSYFNPDVATEYAADPARYGPAYTTLIGRLASAQLEPLPCQVFERTQLPEAFRLLARAGHIGKVVLHLHTPRAALASTPVICADARYLIVGGLGDLGLLLAQWLVDHGARYLALMSRREPAVAERAAVARLETSGAEVRLIRGDVAKEAEVAQAVGTLRRLPQPLRGVFHCAGLLDDGVLEQQTWRRFEHVLAPKVIGAWNLHRCTRDLPLDFFVLFSSVASLLGSPGQANHAAANAYLDALAWHRRADRLSAVSINWGAWASIGAAARSGLSERLALRGFGEIAPDEGLAALQSLLVWPKPQIGMVPIDWSAYRRQFASSREPCVLTEVLAQAPSATSRPTVAPPQVGFPQKLAAAAPGERRALLLELIRTEVIKGLGLQADKQLPMNEPLSALGVDSLLAVELRNALSSALGLSRRLPATLLFDYPSISALTDYLLANVVAVGGERSAPQAVTLTADEASIASMTDEEAEAMLIKELG